MSLRRAFKRPMPCALLLTARARAASTDSSSTQARTSVSFFRKCCAVAQGRPLATAVIFATAKGFFADMAAQVMVEHRRLWGSRGDAIMVRGDQADSTCYDWHRTAALGIFSGLYCGFFYYWQFTVLFPYLWPRGAVAKQWPPMKDVLGQVALDNCFFSPFAYVPTLYIIKGAICFNELPDASLRRYASDFREVVGTLVCIWAPVGLVTFTFMPVWFRAPSMSIVSFFYLIVVSVQSHKLQLQKSAQELDANAGGGQPLGRNA